MKRTWVFATVFLLVLMMSVVMGLFYVRTARAVREEREQYTLYYRSFFPGKPDRYYAIDVRLPNSEIETTLEEALKDSLLTIMDEAGAAFNLTVEPRVHFIDSPGSSLPWSERVKITAVLFVSFRVRRDEREGNVAYYLEMEKCDLEDGQKMKWCGCCETSGKQSERTEDQFRAEATVELRKWIRQNQAMILNFIDRR